MRNAGIESDNQGKHRDNLKEKKLYIKGEISFFANFFHFLKNFEKMADFLNFFEKVIFSRNCAKSCHGATRD